MMTMRRRSLTDRSRLELRQPEKKAQLPAVDSLMGSVTRRLLTAELAIRVGLRWRQEVPHIVALLGHYYTQILLFLNNSYFSCCQ